MKHQVNARSGLWLAVGAGTALLIATPLIGRSQQGQGPSAESFDKLKPNAEIIYLLANSSVIVGPDVSGKNEEITFTGTVVVPKYPLKGFERRQLADGKYQIDFELTNSELYGESYLLDGPILLGEHPDLPSLGTITQRTPGQDYPADFIVQRKVLIKTPAGTLHNEAPVPVRGTIDSIPPVRQLQTPTNLDVFRGEQLPVAMLDERGEIGGWFYSKAHLAFAVDPSAVYRFNATGTVRLTAGTQQEEVAISGPIEVVRLGAEGTTTDEVVAIALRGESRLLGGRIMMVEAFSEKEKFSRGRIPDAGRLDSMFELFFEIKSPAGTLQVPKSIQVDGTVAEVRKTGEVTLSSRSIKVYDAAIQFAGGGGSHAIVDELGRTVAEIRNIKLTSAVPGKGPCCPKTPGGQ